MNKFELITLLKENCEDENAAEFLSKLFIFELEKKGKWKSSYEDIIDKYYEKVSEESL